MRVRTGTVARSRERPSVLCVRCGFRFDARGAGPGDLVRCSACRAEVVVGALHAGRRRKPRTATTAIPGEDPRTAAGCADVEHSGRVALVLVLVVGVVGAFVASHLGLLPEPDPMGAEKSKYCDECARTDELEPPLRAR